jgi:hypothetical protein
VVTRLPSWFSGEGMLVFWFRFIDVEAGAGLDHPCYFLSYSCTIWTSLQTHWTKEKHSYCRGTQPNGCVCSDKEMMK